MPDATAWLEALALVARMVAKPSGKGNSAPRFRFLKSSLGPDGGISKCISGRSVGRLKAAWLKRARCSPLPDFERDLTRDGADLRLSGLLLSPTESRLSLGGLRSAVAVELIWRGGDFAEIAFRPATADLEPARADHMLPVSGRALPGL